MQPRAWAWSTMTNQDNAELRWGYMHKHETPRANIVVLPGLSEPIEKYFETIRLLSSHDCNVYALSWRGQGGSAPYLRDHFRRHSLGFDRDVRDLQRFMDLHVPNNAPRYILAHSMGAMITTLAIQKNPAIANNAFLISPFFGFHEHTGRFFQRFFANRTYDQKFLQAYIPLAGPWQMRATPKSKKPPELFTSDPVRMHLHDWWMKNDPRLRVGGPTMGFVQAASRALNYLNQPGILESIRIPALIFSAGDERIVRNANIFNAAARWPNAFHSHIHGARHEILMEQERYRLPVLESIVDYIRTRPKGP